MPIACLGQILSSNYANPHVVTDGVCTQNSCCLIHRPQTVYWNKPRRRLKRHILVKHPLSRAVSEHQWTGASFSSRLYSTDGSEEEACSLHKADYVVSSPLLMSTWTAVCAATALTRGTRWRRVGTGHWPSRTGINAHITL